MRCFIVISKFLPEYTGAAYRIHNTYKRIRSDFPHFKLLVFCNSTESPTNQDYDYEGVPVERVAFGLVRWMPERFSRALKFYLEAFGTFYKLCLCEKPDVLHIIGASGGTAAALIYSRLFSVPRIVELVTKGASPEQFLPGLRYKNFLKLEEKTVIIAISPEIEQACHALGYSNYVWCRPNPVDEARFVFEREDKNDLRKEITPFGEYDILIGMVAKFMPQKNQIFLLSVIDRLPEKYKLVLVGPLVDDGIFHRRDKAYYDQICKVIEDKNLSGRVYLQKGFADAAATMAVCDIYAMPQMREGLGTPMLEAIASGLPVIANSDEKAFTYWIDKTGGGRACPLDVKSWVNAILTFSDISKPNRQHAAEQVLKHAGHLRLDRSFADLLRVLVDNEADLKVFIEKLSASR